MRHNSIEKAFSIWENFSLKEESIFIIYICLYYMTFCHGVLDRMSEFGAKLSYRV